MQDSSLIVQQTWSLNLVLMLVLLGLFRDARHVFLFLTASFVHHLQQGGKQIDLDPETFEVVRQIQELRNHLSRTGSSQGSAAPGATTADAGTTASATTTTATATAANGATAEATAGDNSAPSATAADGSTATATAAGGNTASAGDGASMASASAGKSPKEIMSDEKLINLFLLMAGRSPTWPHDGPGRSTGGTGESSSGGHGGGSGGSEASGGGSGAQGVDVDGVAGLTAKMSIDDGADAPSGQEADMPPPPPRQWVGAGAGAGETGGGEHGAWGGRMQLTRVHDDTVSVTAGLGT